LVLASGVPDSYDGGNFTGVTIVTNLFDGALFNATNAFAQGTLNLNGGSLFANNIVAGGGISTINLDNGSLTITNTAGSPAARIAAFDVSNSTLHFTLNGSAIITNIVVSNLAAGGVSTVTVDSVANVSSPTTFPLVSYTGNPPTAGNFTKGALPPGFTANLVNNTAEKRIDLVVATNSTVTPRITGLSLWGTNVIVGGSNGFPGGFYYVLVSTNVATPLNLWLPVSTNPFDLNGGFFFTNPMNPGSPQLFYQLRLQ
jgi:hypothetical protein